MNDALTPDEIEAASMNPTIGTKLVLADDGMRIWHIHLKAGQTLAAHCHDRPYFWTVLSGGLARSRDGRGRVSDVAFIEGETRHFAGVGPRNAFVHDLTNIGESDLVFVTAEFEHAQT